QIIVDPDARAALSAVLGQLTASLRSLTWAFVLVGAAVAVIGFLSGRSATAWAARSWASSSARHGDGAALPSRSAVAGHPDLFRLVVLSAGGVVLLLGGLTACTLVVVGIVLAGGLVAVGLLSRPSAGQAV